MFEVRCPKCKRTMLYNTIKKILDKQSKRCVYCARNFKVKNNIVKIHKKRPLNEKKPLILFTYGNSKNLEKGETYLDSTNEI